MSRRGQNTIRLYCIFVFLLLFGALMGYCDRCHKPYKGDGSRAKTVHREKCTNKLIFQKAPDPPPEKRGKIVKKLKQEDGEAFPVPGTFNYPQK